MKPIRRLNILKILAVGIFIVALLLSVMNIFFFQFQTPSVAQAETQYDYLVMNLPQINNSTMSSMLYFELRIYKNNGGKITVNGSSNVISSGAAINFKPRVKLYSRVTPRPLSVSHTHAKNGKNYFCGCNSLSAVMAFPILARSYRIETNSNYGDWIYFDDNGLSYEVPGKSLKPSTNFDVEYDSGRIYHDTYSNGEWQGKILSANKINTGESTGLYGFYDGQMKINLEFTAAMGTDYLHEHIEGGNDGSYVVYLGSNHGYGEFYYNQTVYLNVDTKDPDVELNSVSDGGFSRNDVAVKYSDQTFYSNTLTARYSRNSTSTIPSAGTTYSFANNYSFSQEGNYAVTVTDRVGNATTKTFTIDKTAPTLTLSGVTNGGFTNGTVTASWSTAVGGVGAQLTNSKDTLTVKYSRSTGSTFPTSATTNYTSGTSLTEEGNYLMTITDKAGNSTSYTFTIDKTAPTLTLSGFVVGQMAKDSVSATWVTTVEGAGKNLTNSNDVLTVKYSVQSDTYPTTATTTYFRNTSLTAEGYYLMTITDKTGNVRKYQFLIDKTAPKVAAFDEFTNKTFVFSATDPRDITIEYRHDGGAVTSVQQASVEIMCNESNYGSWEFRAIDAVGNATGWNTIKLYVRDTFGNQEEIKNAYKVPAWYTVRLSTKVFPDIAGTYSFSSHESALDFAIKREWEYRVVELSGGRWSYVNIANESVTQIYDDRATLDNAVLKYAKSYVSNRYIFDVTGSSYPNPTDDEGKTRPDALTSQNLILPEHLAQYADLPLYFIRHTYQFVASAEGVKGNKTSVLVQFLSDGLNPQTGAEISVAYGQALKSALENAGAWRQGFYLVTERDLCGNVEQYLVCLDTELPTVTAKVQYGNGTEELIGFNQEYVTTNEGVMLYSSMDMQGFADNLDEYVMIILEGRSLDRVLYLSSDELPVLCFENGFWGSYTITVYDRSMNALSFVVKIAGEAPYLKYTSLSNETRCTLTIVNNDTGNALTNVELFKITYTGEYIPILEDGDGTPVSPATLVYVLRTGGKYVLRFTDIYGRVVETEPIFYMKGLPSGTLKGVSDGGITNKDVTLEFSSANAVVLYIWRDGKWIEAQDMMVLTEKEGYKKAAISASEANSRLYKFFLYLEEDMNLFVEYRFEIDCIAPSVSIAAEDGEPIEKETVTRKNFKALWDENDITVYYYRTEDPLGELSEKKYTKETIISKAGTYVFKAYDKVGNLTRFNITLDNVVTYTLNGDYQILSDGSFISRTPITLTVTEMTRRFDCESNNGIQIKNGAPIEVDGTYSFSVEDLYGNVLEIKVIIDNLPPVPVIRTADGEPIAVGGTTNKPFTVSCEEQGVTIMLAVSASRYENYNGATLAEEKTYTFKMTDRMNNIATFTVTVDLHVDFSLRGTYIQTAENSYLSRGGITLNVNEIYSAFDVQSERGNRFSAGEKITAEDVYTVTITDMVGNSVVITLVIDQTPPMPEIVVSGETHVAVNGKTNQPFKVTCPEDGAVIKWSMKSSGYTAYNGEEFRDVGLYYFAISDIIGNVMYFTVEIDRGVDFTISGTYVRDGAECYISRSGMAVTVNEEYRRFEVSSETGHTFLPGEKVTLEGKYAVTIEDLGGNVAVITLIIDQTPPVPVIRDGDGHSVEMNAIVNKSVVVSCEEARATIEYSRNDREYLPYNGATLEEAGTVYFKVADLAGNVTRFYVTIDRGVDYTISGTYVVDYLGRYVSRTGLTIKAGEEFSRFEVSSDTGNTFVPDEKIVLEGEYAVTIEDLGGNTVSFTIVIDFTPPVPLITGESGRKIEPGTTINEGFVVAVEERGATIQISTNGTKYEAYDSVVRSVEGTYYLLVTDLVGNSVNFTVTIDKTVEYKLKGSYQTYEGNRFYTRYGVTLEVNEPMAAFEVASDAGNTVTIGKKISKEDTYTIVLEDEVGNRLSIVIVVDYQPPVIVLEGVNGENVTGGDVTVKISDFEKAECRKTGSDDAIQITDVSTFTEDGYYTVRAYDRAGNEATVSFRVDKTVEATPSLTLLSGQYITGEISFKFNETMSAVNLKKDGAELGYSGGTIRETGKYVLTVTDLVGNVAIWQWEILPAAARSYLFAVPDGYGVTATLNGAATDVVRAGSVALEKDGQYSLTFTCGEQSFVIELRVDTVAPTVQIDRAKDKVIISAPNKENVTLTLYRGGKQVDCVLGREITKTGDYVLVVTDELGNTTQYTFSLHYINTFGIIVIVFGCVLLLAVIIIVIVARKKQGVR